MKISVSPAGIVAAQTKPDDITVIARPADDPLGGAEAIGDWMGTTKRVDAT